MARSLSQYSSRRVDNGRPRSRTMTVGELGTTFGAREMAMVAITALALILAGSLSAIAESTLTSVHFEAGQSSATLEGSLVRGDSATYSFSANAGQTADISITALEDNASFAIYQPPATVSHSDGGLDVDGTTIVVDTKSWQGKLPATGAYYVQVGGDRGNASYKLTIKIE